MPDANDRARTGPVVQRICPGPGADTTGVGATCADSGGADAACGLVAGLMDLASVASGVAWRLGEAIAQPLLATANATARAMSLAATVDL